MEKYGQYTFVKSKAGHDKGEIFVIIREDEEYVYLSDGKYRVIEKLKKKNKKHIQVINKVDSSLELKYKNFDPINDNDIKSAIKTYKSLSHNL